MLRILHYVVHLFALLFSVTLKFPPTMFFLTNYFYKEVIEIQHVSLLVAATAHV